MNDIELSKIRCLISGTKSGIGKFLSHELPKAERFDRKAPISKYKKKDYDIIIHCAYDGDLLNGHKNLFNQSISNIKLVEDLCDIECKIFIFFSSVDVYPLNFDGNLSNFKLGFGNYHTRHAFFKMIGESIVLSKIKNYLILRPTLMVGKDARLSTVTNIICGKKGPYSLTKTSRFNIITHDQIFFCIQAALRRNKTGIINLFSDLEFSLEELAKQVKNENISWGKFEYKTPKIKEINPIQLFGGRNNTIQELISTVRNF